MYNLTCPSSESDPSDCTATPAPASCDHFMDLGVRCLSHHEVCASMNDESGKTATVRVTEITTHEPSSTQSSRSSSRGPISSKNCTKSTQAVDSSCISTTVSEDGLGTAPTESNLTNLNQFSGELVNVNKTLGALTGLLAAALVVVTMGWIVSCVYLMRRIRQR